MEKNFFSKDELQRYSRHLILPEFGAEGQEKLKKAKILVVGAGGLGCPMLQYLTAAGVGTIGIVDFDTVDRSNLQRQVLFTEDDIGKFKSDTAIERLSRLNPNITFNNHQVRLTSANSLELAKEYDLIADGTDNFPTRYLVNDVCILLDKPNVHGSIFRFEGQVSVFNYKYSDGSRGPQYRDIFPSPPPPGLVTSCAEGGVLGVLPGIIGSVQASEAIKLMADIGEPLAGKLFIFDALSMESHTMKIRKNPDLESITELIDYEDFCGLSQPADEQIQNITAQELQQFLTNNVEGLQMIDVREPSEFALGNIGGKSIPLGQIESRQSEIQEADKTVVICRSGIRSQKAIAKLQSAGRKNLYNLDGGLLKWAKEVDESLVL